jgi:hypothetical protein
VRGDVCLRPAKRRAIEVVRGIGLFLAVEQDEPDLARVPRAREARERPRQLHDDRGARGAVVGADVAGDDGLGVVVRADDDRAPAAG